MLASAFNRRQNARFDILILNFQRIGLFFDNFHKLKNFDPARDRIVVLDCSQNIEREQGIVEAFARERGWVVGGPELVFVPRTNWGIDQGGRVDYLGALLQDPAPAPYIWQFQEHYLDNTSDYSRCPPSSGALAGTVKEDVIPDGAVLDLDLSERAFADPEVSVVFASRNGVGVFRHTDGRSWFYSDGANLGFRTSAARSAFSQSLLDDYRIVFDGSYRWALFIEFEFGNRLSNGAWFDLMRERTFENAAAVREAELASGQSLSSSPDPRYIGVVDRYERRMQRARGFLPVVRRAILATVFPAVGVFQSRVFLLIRAKLLARNIDSPVWFRNLW